VEKATSEINGQIDKETYDLTFGHLSNQLLAIGKELNSGKPTIFYFEVRDFSN
jgi:hypothetical protein